MKKSCIKCGQIKSLDQFYKRNNSASGYRSHCKSCTNSSNLQWNAKNRDRVNKWKRSYRKRPEVRAKDLEYERRVRKENPQFKIAQNIRRRLRRAIKNSQKAGSAVRDLGCTVSELQKHLESQFKPGMSWDNYSYRGWHIDHIVPLCKFDLTNPNELAKACHYTNLQPLWSKENMSKGRISYVR